MLYGVRQPFDLAETRAIIVNVIFSTARAVELTDQGAETNKTCMTHKREHETYVARLKNLASQRILLLRKTADILAHALDAAVSLPSLLKLVQESS